MKKILLLALLLPLTHSLYAQDECGTWRWRVKLLLDRSGIDWFKQPAASMTISQMINNKDVPNQYEPVGLADADMERQPYEQQMVQLTCYVYDVKVNEKDMEYRLLLSQHKDGTGDKMCAFVPNPACSSLNAYPYLKRKYADVRYVADEIKTWTDAGYVVKVELTGVPFWAMPTGKKSYAANGIEIHPVFRLKAHLPKTAGHIPQD